MIAVLAGSTLVCLDVESRLHAQEAKAVSFEGAMSAAYGLKEAGKLDESRLYYEKALELARKDRDKCEAHQALMRIYPETGSVEKMYDSLEYIIEHAPYPAFASLSLRSALSICQRKGLQIEMQQRYQDRLKNNPKDRTALVIMEEFTSAFTRDYALRGEYLQRLIDLDREEGKTSDPQLFADRAFAWKLNREYEKAAELYESTAALSEDIGSSCWKDAAECWKQLDQGEKALAAAMKSHDLGPDKRVGGTPYHWHRSLGEIFLWQKKQALALEHLEAAVKTAPIDAYREQCETLVLAAKGLSN